LAAPAAYTADLSRVHHEGFGMFAREAGAGMLKMLREAGIRGGLVVDLGCGSGIWPRELLRAGYEVLGIDQSAAMLALARKQARGATFRRGSFTSARLPACAAVTAQGEVFNYLFDAKNTRAALGGVFRRVFDALEPGGLFLFDMACPGRGMVTGRARRAVVEDDWAVFVKAEEQGRILTRDITTFHKHGRHYRRTDEVHRLRLWTPAEVAAVLRRAGFRAQPVRRYGSYELPAGLVGYRARKP
jgi:SAM-dependent methyltransferase